MKLRRIASAVTALTLVVAFSVPTLASKTTTYVPQAQANVTPLGKWPLTDKKTSFKFFTQVSGQTMENIETNAFTAWYEEKTNVHIDWDIVTTGAGTRIPLIIASGDLPDVFFGGNISDVQLTTYALVDKVFVPLTDSINKYAPNVKQMIAEYPLAKQYSYMPDGNIYSLLRVVDTYNERVTKRAWVYQPWLEKLNIKMPETTEEFYNMLVAFRDKDPNGNGKKDEVPYAGALLNNPANNEPESFILNSFLFYEGGTYLEVKEDGKTLQLNATSEQYREGLRYLNKLYNEGLLDKASWTQDRNGLRALTEGSDRNMVGAVSAMYWGHFTSEGGMKDGTRRDLEFTAIPVLKGPEGVRNAYDRGQLVNNGKLVVTKACKNVDLIVRWADWFFDPDAMLEEGFSANYGPEGTGWRKATTGEKNASGKQSTYTFLRAVDTKQNDNWFQTEPYFESRAFIDSITDNDAWRKEAFGGAETSKKYLPYSAFDKKVPFMFTSLDDLDYFNTLKDLFTNSSTGEFVVWRNQFITGEKSLDKDWDTYVNSLKRMRVQDYLNLYQKMFTDYLKVQASIKK